MINQLPSPFVVEWLPRIARLVPPPARALDLASGRGRHTRLLARAGFHAFGVDLDRSALVETLATARADALRVSVWCADLTTAPIPREAFEVVLVTRYLDRGRFPDICASVRGGGVVLYETFTIGQRAHRGGPRSPSHLLELDELRRRFDGFEVLFYEEVREPEALARIVARKPV